MNILVPQGIGDAIWAIHKVQDLAKKHGDGIVHIKIACLYDVDSAEKRALDFIRRFSFVQSAEMYVMPERPGCCGAVLLPGEPADENGYYRYIPDGIPDPPLPGIDYVLMPNTPLEHGIRLEEWLPTIKTNWNIMKSFQFTDAEIDRANEFAKGGEYAIFFLGSETSNGIAGHNRSGIWTPQDWMELGKRIKEELGLRIVVVGAEYDSSYFHTYISDNVDWENLIGDTEVGDLFAIARKARFVISYQSGVGIVSNYFGVPTGIFWRARGDSISADYYLSFQEAMASAWVNPLMLTQKKHLPLIYGRDDVSYIMQEIKERKW